MRIAIDCRSVFQGMGGIGQYTCSLVREFAKLDATNRYVCYFTHLDPPEPLQLPANFVIRSFQAGMIDERFDQFILPTLLREDRIDVYHNPTFAVPVVRNGTRTVATIHDVVFRRNPNLVEPKLRRYLDIATRRACNSADRLITVSEFSKKEMTELYEVPPDRVTVIPNGVRAPAQLEAPSAQTQRRLMEHGLEGARYALYVGSVEPKKNIDLLLRAFRSVVDRLVGTDLKLAMAGPRGTEPYDVDSRIKELGLTGRVSLLGFVHSDLLEVLYRNALLFVYPSLYEGFGLPPLEAMARGVPTIVSNASSLPEVVGDAAILVDSANPESLTNTLVDLVRDSRRREDLGRKGKERAESFSWRRSAEAHLDVYQSLASSHESRASGV
jgi:glycosyltransferase involved in cell wall biosynthesis